MTLAYKTRRRLALLILLIGLPVYIITAVTLVGLIDRPSVPLELAVYVGLGFLWMLPLRPIFRGIGQPDPDQPNSDQPNSDQPDPDQPNSDQRDSVGANPEK